MNLIETSKSYGNGRNEVRIGCNICEKECPHKVPVNTIMRYNYYFHSRGMEKKAMKNYRDLQERRATYCQDCYGYCEQACPHGVRSRFLLARVHEDLSFDGQDMETSLIAILANL